jgi:hypothetical protein
MIGFLIELVTNIEEQIHVKYYGGGFGVELVSNLGSTLAGEDPAL